MSQQLLSTTSEILTLPSGTTVEVPKCVVSFEAWNGEAVNDTYGNKQVLNLNGEPLFAELVVRAIFMQNGWEGVWVDSYRKCFRTKLPDKSKEDFVLPDQPRQIFEKIVEQTGFKGCWDVFLWNGTNVLFVECKRSKKDEIRESQLVWLETSLKLGLSPHNFLLVEWDIK